MDAIIPDLLEKWHDTKQQIIQLEAECDRYKRAVGKLMDKSGNESLKSKFYTVKRRNISKQTLTKNSVPSDIWTKYAKDSTFTAYYLTENK